MVKPKDFRNILDRIRSKQQHLPEGVFLTRKQLFRTARGMCLQDLFPQRSILRLWTDISHDANEMNYELSYPYAGIIWVDK